MITAKQTGVLRGMAMGLCLTLIAGGVGLGLSPDWLVPQDSLSDRLTHVSGWSLLPLACLLLTIGNLARHRFFTPEDIDGSGLTVGSERAKTYQAILQNTLEQTVLALPLYWTSAFVLPSSQLAVIPLLAGCFFTGRLLFFLGYKKGAAARAVGFALTFYPSVFLFLLLVSELAFIAMAR
ncbi:MAPEG family protein [Rhodovibrionaceae bacterium A322]